MTDSNQNQGLSQAQIDSVIDLFSSGQLDDALAVAKKLTKGFPDNSLLHNITGACYAGLSKLDSAVQSYQKAIEIDPTMQKRIII